MSQDEITPITEPFEGPEHFAWLIRLRAGLVSGFRGNGAPSWAERGLLFAKNISGGNMAVHIADGAGGSVPVIPEWQVPGAHFAVEERRAPGVQLRLNSGQWTSRPLNEVTKTNAAVSFGGGRSTFSTGLWQVEAMATGYRCGNHAAALYWRPVGNTPWNRIQGTTAYSDRSNGVCTSASNVMGQIDARTTAIEVELVHWCDDSNSEGGGVSTSGLTYSIFASLRATRIG